jgi:hypothetical protein
MNNLPTRLLLTLVLALAACQLARAEAAPRPVIRVALAPVVVDTMSGIAWRAMTDECNGIWAREGIALTWSGASTGDDVVLPLVFDHREVKKHDPKDADALGVTIFAGRSQRILVSLGRARDVIGRGTGWLIRATRRRSTSRSARCSAAWWRTKSATRCCSPRPTRRVA